LKVAIQPWKFALKVSVKLATPPESLTESLQQTCNKLSGQQKNYRKKLVFFKKSCFPKQIQKISKEWFSI
jgi:hypothetical protein